MADTTAKADAAAKAQLALKAKRDATKALQTAIMDAAATGKLVSEFIHKPITDSAAVVTKLREALATVETLLAELDTKSVSGLEAMVIFIRAKAFQLKPAAAQLDDLNRIKKLMKSAKSAAQKLATAITSIEQALSGNTGVMAQLRVAASQLEAMVKPDTNAAEGKSKAG